MANIHEINEKPDIKYPTLWEYKFILEAGINAQNTIDELVRGREYELKFSKFSSDKKYASYNLKLTVNSEKERLEIFNAIKNRAKYVL
ncbi:DUF493 domain-containing protein [Campylobacter sp. CCUG 57310]|uniref:HP0495 family protein n=1 Tax=Campylobacter sp. CCUG 57310 TaxID=2517362 RepID=UPI0015664D88|nr:DUF493 domain-containing protein [Campylobacter sp. CCUG 57310]QKF93149.1 DUF493 domain-containing protein [Campylobacter sp. CCUG 57310]